MLTGCHNGVRPPYEKTTAREKLSTCMGVELELGKSVSRARLHCDREHRLRLDAIQQTNSTI